MKRRKCYNVRAISCPLDSKNFDGKEEDGNFSISLSFRIPQTQEKRRNFTLFLVVRT